MIIAKVVGTVISTIKHKAYHGYKLHIIQPMQLAGEATISADDSFLAIDSTQAGIGDTVLVMREGNGALQITKIENAPIISMIVGILDSVEITR